MNDVDINYETKYKATQGVYAMHKTLKHLDYVTDDVIEFSTIVYEMLELYSRKNRDYGDAFNKSLDEDGLLVSKIRLGDKMNRFSSLLKKEATVSSESVRDTLVDLANYAAMTVQWMDRKEREAREQYDEELADIPDELTTVQDPTSIR